MVDWRRVWQGDTRPSAVTDPQGVFLEANRAWRRLQGGDPVGRPLAEIVVDMEPADLPMLAKATDQSLPGRGVLDGQVTSIAMRRVSRSGHLAVTADIAFARFQALERELRAANKEARSRLALQRAAAERGALLAAINAAPAETSIVVEDMEGCIVSWNRGAERNYGYSEDEAIGQPVAMLHEPGPAGDEAMARLRSLAARDGEATGTFTQCRKDGSRFSARVAVTRMEEEGRTRGFLFMGRDLTEELERAERERRLLLEKEAAEASDRAKSAFLANMSHELRTPLNGIIGFSELLQQGRATTETQTKEFVGEIRAAGQHLLRIISDLLDLSKVDAGRLTIEPERTDAQKLAWEVLASLRPSIEEKGHEVSVHVEPDVRAFVVDPTRLKQVLYNYISNAIKFTPPGGRVQVRFLREGEASVRLEVEDDGPGVPQGERERIFREFEQLDEGPGKQHEGTGLGLALAKRLVETHGGSVGMEAASDGGSLFYAVLPGGEPMGREEPALSS